MKVPVVLSNAGYTQFLFTHEKDCLIVPAQNPFALAEALQRLIGDGALCAKLVRGAQDLLHQYKKDRVSIVQEIRAYYDEIQWHRVEISHHA